MKKGNPLRQSTIIAPKTMQEYTLESLKEETEQNVYNFHKPVSYPIQAQVDNHDQAKEFYDSTVMGSHPLVNSETDSA